MVQFSGPSCICMLKPVAKMMLPKRPRHVIQTSVVQMVCESNVQHVYMLTSLQYSAYFKCYGVCTETHCYPSAGQSKRSTVSVLCSILVRYIHQVHTHSPHTTELETYHITDKTTSQSSANVKMRYSPQTHC